MTISQLLSINGRYITPWRGENKQLERVYFNNLDELVGLNIVYNDLHGNDIKKAFYMGKEIKPGRALTLIERYNHAKFWFDIKTRKWGWKDITREEAIEIYKSIASICKWDKPESLTENATS